MKKGRNLVDLAKELQRQMETKKDYIVPTSMMTFAVDANRLHIDNVNGDSDVGMTDHFHGQVSDRLKIPKKYYDRMRTEAPELLANNVNHWLKNADERRLVRLLDGDARAYLSNRYRPIDNYDMAESLLPTIQDMGCSIESCELTARRMYIKAVTSKIEGEVGVGDVVQAGIMISNSEIGAGSVQVVPLVYRLQCLNGMIVADQGIKRYHTGKWIDQLEDAVTHFSDATIAQDNKALFMKMRDIVKAALTEEGFAEILNSFKAAASMEIKRDPVKVVEDVSKKFAFTDDEKGGVLSHLIKGGDLSKWGLANAITRQSQDVEDYDRATDFERFGGQVVELKDNEWEVLAEVA